MRRRSAMVSARFNLRSVGFNSGGRTRSSGLSSWYLGSWRWAIGYSSANDRLGLGACYVGLAPPAPRAGPRDQQSGELRGTRSTKRRRSDREIDETGENRAVSSHFVDLAEVGSPFCRSRPGYRPTSSTSQGELTRTSHAQPSATRYGRPCPRARRWCRADRAPVVGPPVAGRRLSRSWPGGGRSRPCAEHGHQGDELVVIRCAAHNLDDRHLRLISAHSGMFPCLRGGGVSRLVRSTRSARVTDLRVCDGEITPST